MKYVIDLAIVIILLLAIGYGHGLAGDLIMGGL